MKIAIIFYSYSGNTKKVAQVLADYFKDKGEVDLVELKALDEKDNFFSQGARAFKRIRAKIDSVNFDLSAYDIICLGTPVWAFGPAPAMNTYLDNCSKIRAKQIILFTTFGSGTGNKRCLNYMEQILSKKGPGSFKYISIQQAKCKDSQGILSEIKKIT